MQHIWFFDSFISSIISFGAVLLCNFEVAKEKKKDRINKIINQTNQTLLEINLTLKGTTFKQT